jgi:hypothetical protein
VTRTNAFVSVVGILGAAAVLLSLIFVIGTNVGRDSAREAENELAFKTACVDNGGIYTAGDCLSPLIERTTE